MTPGAPSPGRAVLAIDEGSTGVRAVLFDASGTPVGQAYREITSRYPQPGRVEQDPEEIWRRTVEVVGEALAMAGIAASELAAVGLTGQRSTAVAWSRKTGRPLHAALSWQDLRCAERCQELLAAGHFVTPLAAASKLEWLARNAPEVRAGLASGDALLGTLESFLVWQLSGGAAHVTDASFASTSGLYEFFEGRWSRPLLELLGLPEASLPEIRGSSEIYATTSAAAFGAAVPIGGLAGDQQAAVFGQLCLTPGATKVSYGTSAMVDRNAGTSPLLSSHGAFPLVLWRLAGETHYCLEGSAITAGAAVQWLRDGLAILKSPDESAALAASVPDSGGVWFVPAFQGLGTPHLDPQARAAIGGLSRGSMRAHVVRALLEGVALRVAEIVAAIAEDAGAGLPAVLRADGGASRNDFLMQYQSDVLGIPVERPAVLDAAATGAAYLAGLATGFWSDSGALERIWRLGARFEPRWSAERREQCLERFRKRVALVREAGTEPS